MGRRSSSEKSYVIRCFARSFSTNRITIAHPNPSLASDALKWHLDSTNLKGINPLLSPVPNHSQKRLTHHGRSVDEEIQGLCREGLLSQALHCLCQIDVPPTNESYVSLFKTCANKKALSLTKLVYCHLILHGIDIHGHFGEHLVLTLCKCDDLQDALHVLHVLPSRTTLSWTAVISSLVEYGRNLEAISLFQNMVEDDVEPGSQTLSYLLRACSSIPNLEWGRKLHHKARLKGYTSQVFINNILVTMYRKCGMISEAEEVFAESTKRDVVSWNSMLAAYVALGEGEKAMLLYRQMIEEHVAPSQQSLVMALQACWMLAEIDEIDILKWGSRKGMYLDIVQALHADAKRNGFDSHTFVGTTFITMYGRFGTIRDAEFVSSTMCDHDVVSWTAMLSAYGHQGQGKKALQLYKEMLEEGMSPDPKAFAIALQACGTLSESEENGLADQCTPKDVSLRIVKALHADAWKRGYGCDSVLGNTLVNMYGKCGSIRDAEILFCSLPNRDLTTWTMMMSAYTVDGQAKKAIMLYRQMLDESIEPDHQTYAAVTQTCIVLAEMGDQSIKSKSLEIGRALHADARKKGIESDSFVCNSLVNLYGKCGSILEAENLFKQVMHPDQMLWLRMLTAYLDQEQEEAVLYSYEAMQDQGITPNPQTFLVAIQACGALAQKEESIVMEGRSVKVKALQMGQAFLFDAQKKGLHSDVFVATALVNLLGKSGSVEDAETICNSLVKADVVLCTAMLSVYVEQGQAEKALELYWKMHNDNFLKLDDITLVCVLQACGKTGALEISRNLHFTIASASTNLSCYLASALSFAYGSCAHSVDVQAILECLVEPDLVTWNACVASYSGEGNLTACTQMVHQMELLCLKPDEVTFVSLLSACSHAGLVHRGLELIETMNITYHVGLDLKHYGTILDLLGRAGDFKRLGNILEKLPLQPDMASWLCLLGSCRIHGNVELAKTAFENAVRLQPKEHAPYLLMSQIYTDAGLQYLADEVEKLRPQGGKNSSCMHLD